MNPGDHEEQIARRFATLGVREADLEESFVRSGGHGGQNVNKVATCVLLVHRPSGMQVKCQTTRHQGQNRVLAREMLLAKMEAKIQADLAGQRTRAEKLKRQSRGRSQAAKRRILADKVRNSQKKANRKFQPPS